MTDMLNGIEERIFRSGRCPDCKGPLRLGPSGGWSQNYYCGHLGESMYNDNGPFGVERVGRNRCPELLEPVVAARAWTTAFWDWLKGLFRRR